MSNDDRSLIEQGDVSFFGKKDKIKKALARIDKKGPMQVDSSGQMTTDRINEILERDEDVSDLIRYSNGQWTFQYRTQPAYIMTDDRKGVDRMRIMAQIAEDPRRFSITAERLLQANCHEALDARFCYEADGSLWAAFIHPLSTLAERDLISGMKQVTHLATVFPRSLSSLDLVFRGTDPDLL